MDPISERLAEAFSYALARHRQQLRKGTEIPYILAPDAGERPRVGGWR